MTALKPKIIDITAEEHNLFKDYNWFYSNIYLKTQKSVNEFFQNNFQLRFLGLANQENILFYGDEYFVNKIPVNKSCSIMIRISANLVSSLLDNALGLSENSFALNELTDIEAGLIKSFTVFVYKNIEDILEKPEPNKKIVQSSKEYNITFYARLKHEHIGKIIITLPEYMLPEIKHEEISERFSISDFKTAKTALTIGTGSAKITLNEIKALENGDIIVLDNSDINKMFTALEGKEIKFKINPNPALIISIDNNGGNEMEEETSAKSQSMWDSILVDIVAEFDNVKLTLGELKQISEGLVIDVGSVYDNKIKLRVENQIVAEGELVILNDRYGVRIDNVKKSKEEQIKPAAKPLAEVQPNEPAAKHAASAKPAARPTARPAVRPAAGKPAARPAAKPTAAKPIARPMGTSTAADNENAHKEGDENFDYSDFEIEDESI